MKHKCGIKDMINKVYLQIIVQTLKDYASYFWTGNYCRRRNRRISGHRSKVWICSWGNRGQWIDLPLDIFSFDCAQYRFWTVEGQIGPCCGVGDSKFIVKAKHLIQCQISRDNGLKQYFGSPSWKHGFDVYILDMKCVQKHIQIT